MNQKVLPTWSLLTSLTCDLANTQSAPAIKQGAGRRQEEAGGREEEGGGGRRRRREERGGRREGSAFDSDTQRITSKFLQSSRI